MQVSGNSIIAIIIAIIFSVVFPLGLMIFTKKKTGVGVKSFFVGCGVFFVSVVILEQIFHSLVLSTSVGQNIKNNLIAYSIYGGLCAGIFEETGRFVAFKTLLKKNRDVNETALMYGVGHGGFEVFYILFFMMINNLIYAISVNSGNISSITSVLSGEKLAAVETIIKTLCETKSIMFYVAIIERISAVILHVSLSILVWFAVKNKKQWWLYPVAILLHACIDIIPGLCKFFGDSIAITEILIFIFAVTVYSITLLHVWLKNQPYQEVKS